MNERERLAALAGYDILDTPRERDFDEVAELAADICGTPIAVVNLIGENRQFFKAEVGLGVRETPLDSSFCARAILEEEFLLIPDATKDPRFECNPLVTGEPHLRFYAGALMRTIDGHAIGTVCVLDYRPRDLTDVQHRTLRVLARQVMTQLELRRALRQQVQVEAALRESEASLRALNADLERQVIERSLERGRTWQVSPDLLSVLDLETGVFDRVNPAWTAALGWTAAELEGHSYVEFVHPDDLPASEAAFEVLQRGDPLLRFENRYRHKDGSYRVLSWVAVPVGAKLYSRAHDVTEEKERAVRLAERTAELDRVWRNSQDLQGVIDAQGVFVAVSPSALRLLGWAPEEMVGRSLFEFTDPDEHEDSRLKRAIKEPLPPQTNRYRHRDGTYRSISWTTTPENGLIYCYGRDVTVETEQSAALALVEDALRQSQKLEAVGQLTGGVAHDFNNLLTVIKSSSDLLKRPNLPEERRARYVDAIIETVDRASKLTGQLLAFARRQALKPEAFDACRSVRSIADMVGTLAGSRVAVDLRVPDEPCYIQADPNQFETALVNLAVNARDAMDGEGRLTITVRTAGEVPAMRAHKAIPGDYVAVSLTDTGCGIATERLGRIFEPFFTTKGVGQGTGLGLSQVFGFAKQSGGEVMVESEVARGSTFTLYLPRTEAPAAPVDPEVGNEAAEEGHGACVLVVEDNRAVGEFSTQTLAELGYRTHWVASAAEALSELARTPGAHDIVFSDVVMPGMNGVELGREIERLYPDLPVVLTSGYSHVLASDGDHGFELLQKPYSVEALSRILRKAVAKQRWVREKA